MNRARGLPDFVYGRRQPRALFLHAFSAQDVNRAWNPVLADVVLMDSRLMIAGMTFTARAFHYSKNPFIANAS
jgi:hypothetical protein